MGSKLNQIGKRILIGSWVHRQPQHLRPFMESLKKLEQNGLEFNFLFVQLNTESRGLLLDFAQTVERVNIVNLKQREEYRNADNSKNQYNRTTWKLADAKNQSIHWAIKFHYDYLFLVDSDLLVHPSTVLQLVNARKDIISEIYWTTWKSGVHSRPQVWVKDEFEQWVMTSGKEVGPKAISEETKEFIKQVGKPGVYKVAGLGGCTLISRHALLSGVSFDHIKNLSIKAEDHHFSIRAAALGLPMYVDTHYPAYHLYPDSKREDAKAHLVNTIKESHLGKKTKINGSPIYRHCPKLTLSMVVRNEANNYLKKVLNEHRKYIDGAVIIDDGSSDNTIETCLQMLNGIPIHLVRNEESKFARNELELRRQQWEETMKTNPQWILNLDADELFERRFVQEVPRLLNQNDFDVFCFRLYDFWNDTHYRDDAYWRSHFTYRPFLVRYIRDFNYAWKEIPLHCGRFPENIFGLPHRVSNLRLKHLGWSKPEDRLKKFNRYQMLDPGAQYGRKEQYLSILDENPKLTPWIE